MSVKHVKAYYEEVAEQRKEMLENLKDFEQLAMENMFDEDRLNEIKLSIQPLLRNYEMLSYVMYLLNKPNRKRKEDRYVSANKKLLSNIPQESTHDGVIATNKSVLKTLNDLKEQ